VWPAGVSYSELVSDDPSETDRELARLRAGSDAQDREIAKLRGEAAEASGEIAHLGVEADDLHRRERDLTALVLRLRNEARVREEVVGRLLEQLAADERELNDLRAVRDALTPPELGEWPGVELAASFVPATEGVSGDFYLVAEGPQESTTLIVGDVVGKGLVAARRAAFVRTVFATTAPFSDDPARLLSWANTALFERSDSDLDYVTAGCVTVSPTDGVVRWGYAGHPPVLWLDTGEELSGARALPLGLVQDWECTSGAHRLSVGEGVLLYTDGVTEARGNGEQFGQERLVRSVQTLEGHSPPEVVTTVTTKVREFAASGLVDDLCLVAARIGEP
jgi:serine phosphatase RsbU (regulator of sigma subunit)